MSIPYIEGLDVSKHQGSPNWDAIAATKRYAFVICKATEGRSYIDPKWYDNAAGLKATGMFWGGYHFARPSTVGGRADGEAEAKDFAAALRNAGCIGAGTLPPALDWEEYPERKIADNLAWIEGFVEVIESELGRSPMIYTGKNVWNYTTGNSDKWKHLPLWQVSYTEGVAPAKGLPWDKWTIWQWSGGGTVNFAKDSVPSINGAVDRNRYWADHHSLDALASPTIWTPQQPWNPDSEAHAPGTDRPDVQPDKPTVEPDPIPAMPPEIDELITLYEATGQRIMDLLSAAHDIEGQHHAMGQVIAGLYRNGRGNGTR